MEDTEVREVTTSAAKTNDPDGRRMQLLNYGIQTSIKKCLSAVRYARIEKVLSPIAQSSPEILKQIHKQMECQLQTNIMDEISSMFEEENISGLMNNLDKIIEETSLGPDEQAWRPSGDPSLDVLPHVYSTKLKERSSLEKILKEVEDKNRQLHEALRPRQQRLETLKKDVLKECQYWEEAAGAIPEDYKQKMEKFIRT
ncbi:polyamine-modulated factor 1-like [Gigantopelta aegis]|uniref:polyamine-modulated factor 1-like n=1 Tax=Gigantopelta aegis TaxID=1735272 RepID=UPI001B888E20|nr:polyamine-modulated factor 1-like [Gigantopelta aegis]